MCETKYDVFLKMNALFQYIHSFINKYNFNLYVTSIQPHFLLCNHKKECSVTRQIPEVDTCRIPALPLRKPNPTTLELHGLITTLEFAQKETNSLWKITLESWKVQKRPISVSKYLHSIQSIYQISVKAGLLHWNNSINNGVFSPNYMTKLLVNQIKITSLPIPDIVNTAEKEKRIRWFRYIDK